VANKEKNKNQENEKEECVVLQLSYSEFINNDGFVFKTGKQYKVIVEQDEFLFSI